MMEYLDWMSRLSYGEAFAIKGLPRRLGIALRGTAGTWSSTGTGHP